MCIRGKPAVVWIPGKSGEFLRQRNTGIPDSLITVLQVFSPRAQVDATEDRAGFFGIQRLSGFFHGFQCQVGSDNFPGKKKIRQKSLRVLISRLSRVLAEDSNDPDSLIFQGGRIAPASFRIGMYLERMYLATEQTWLKVEFFYASCSEILKGIVNCVTI